MGIATFAFGIGGPLANFAGLLHMTMHSLIKSSIFFTVGHIAQVKGTQRFSDMGGLSITHPVLAVGFTLGVIAISGLPPFRHVRVRVHAGVDHLRAPAAPGGGAGVSASSCRSAP